MKNNYNYKNIIIKGVYEMGFGNILYKIRKEQKLGQTELCHGICSISTLSRIESEDRIPDLLLFETFITRLGKDNSKWEFIVSKKDRDLLELRNKIEYFIWSEKWSELEDKLKQYGKLLKRGKKLHTQYVCFIYGILYKEKKEYAKAMEYCCEGLEKTQKVHTVNVDVIKDRLSKNELELLFLVGEILTYTEQSELKLYTYWKKLYNYVKEFCVDEEYRSPFEIKISYYLGRICYKSEEKIAIHYIINGIKIIKEKNTIYYLEKYIELMKEFSCIQDDTLLELVNDADSILELLHQWKYKSMEIEDSHNYIKSLTGAYSINEIIRNTRKALRKVQGDMVQIDVNGNVKGDQSNLSKIENEKISPRGKTKKSYMKQLGLGEKDESFQLAIVGESFTIQEVKWEIDNCILTDNIEKAEKLLSYLKGKIDYSINKNRQYIRKVEFFIKLEREYVSKETHLKEIKEILGLTVNNVERIIEEDKIRGFLTREELVLVMNIGYCYHIHKEYDRAIYFYEKLEYYFREYYSLSSGRLYSILLHNLSQVYGLTGEYEKSLQKCYACIFMNMYLNKEYILCKALYNIGWCYGNMMIREKTNNKRQYYKDMCQRYLLQAETLAKFFGDEVIQDLVKEKMRLWMK